MSEEASKPVVLRVYKDGQLQTIKQFTHQQIVIGQSVDVQLPLNHSSVSIIHAAIEYREAGYFVCDLGSESGTFVNGAKVLDAKIESGDEIQVGDYKIEFFIGAPKTKTAPVAESTLVSNNVSNIIPTIESPPAAPVAAPVAATVSVAPPVVSVPPIVEPIIAPITAVLVEPVPVAADEPKLPEAKPPENVLNQAPIIPIVAPVALQMKPIILTNTKSNDQASSKNTSFESGGLETYSRRAPKKTHKKATFAVESKYKNVDEFVKPSRGTVVEVLVAWKERVLSTYHFSKPGTFTFGSHPEADIQIPLMFAKQRKSPLLKIDSRLLIMLAPEMTGEMIRQGQTLSFSELIKQNRLVRNGNLLQLALDQGEMMKIELGELSLILRYVSEAPKPLVAPLLDLTAAESVGVIFAVVLVMILAVYNYLYTPPRPLEDAVQEDPMRQAIIIVKPPTPIKIKEEPTPISTPVPTPPPVKSTPAPKKLEEKPVVQPKKETISDKSKVKDAGKAAAAAPNKVKEPAKVVGIKRGGSIKTTDQAASQVQSKPLKDLKKSGVFSVFGGGGKNNELSKETAGVGELAGLSNQATGRSGLNENRAGEGLGTIYDTGRGGNGTAAVGRPDVQGGNGRGTGQTGYGSGGIGGGRQGVKIRPGGSEESFSGTIDREAIRRVIQANLKAIRACYEKQLNRRPDLFGKLVIEWDIGDAGRVIRAHVKSSELSDPEVGSCVVNHLKTWTFPTPPTNNEVTVSFPFFFSN
jgi:pSer/pThr/pTyr-binding forkhead associated (FHA) protein/outer membrane biosynthesis protein TonB